MYKYLWAWFYVQTLIFLFSFFLSASNFGGNRGCIHLIKAPSVWFLLSWDPPLTPMTKKVTIINLKYLLQNWKALVVPGTNPSVCSVLKWGVVRQSIVIRHWCFEAGWSNAVLVFTCYLKDTLRCGLIGRFTYIFLCTDWKAERECSK